MAVPNKDLHKVYISLLNRIADNTGYNYWTDVNFKENLELHKFASFFLQDLEARSHYEIIKKIQDKSGEVRLKSLQEPSATWESASADVYEALNTLLENKDEKSDLYKFASTIYKNVTNKDVDDVIKLELLTLITSTFRDGANTEEGIWENLGTIATKIVENYSNTYTENAVKISDRIVDMLNSFKVESATDVTKDGVYAGASVLKGLLIIAESPKIDDKITEIVNGMKTVEDVKKLFVIKEAPTTDAVDLATFKGSALFEGSSSDDKLIHQPSASTEYLDKLVVDGQGGKDTLELNLIGADDAHVAEIYVGSTANGKENVFAGFKNIESYDINFGPKASTAVFAGDSNTSDDVIKISGAKLTNITAKKVEKIEVVNAPKLVTVTGDDTKQTLNFATNDKTLTVKNIETVVIGSGVNKLTVSGSADDAETLVLDTLDSTLTLTNIDKLVLNEGVDSVNVAAAGDKLKSVEFAKKEQSVTLPTVDLGESGNEFKVKGEGNLLISGDPADKTLYLTGLDGKVNLDLSGIKASDSKHSIDIKGTDAQDSITLNLGSMVANGSSAIGGINIDISSTSGNGGADTIDLSSYKGVGQFAGADNHEFDDVSAALNIKGLGIEDTIKLNTFGAASNSFEISVASIANTDDFDDSVGQKANATNTWHLLLKENSNGDYTNEVYLFHEGASTTASIYNDDLIIRLESVDSALVTKLAGYITANKTIKVTDGLFGQIADATAQSV